MYLCSPVASSFCLLFLSLWHLGLFRCCQANLQSPIIHTKAERNQIKNEKNEKNHLDHLRRRTRDSTFPTDNFGFIPLDFTQFRWVACKFQFQLISSSFNQNKPIMCSFWLFLVHICISLSGVFRWVYFSSCFFFSWFALSNYTRRRLCKNNKLGQPQLIQLNIAKAHISLAKKIEKK